MDILDGHSTCLGKDRMEGWKHIMNDNWIELNSIYSNSDTSLWKTFIIT